MNLVRKVPDRNSKKWTEPVGAVGDKDKQGHLLLATKAVKIAAWMTSSKTTLLSNKGTLAKAVLLRAQKTAPSLAAVIWVLGLILQDPLPQWLLCFPKYSEEEDRGSEEKERQGQENQPENYLWKMSFLCIYIRTDDCCRTRTQDEASLATCSDAPGNLITHFLHPAAWHWYMPSCSNFELTLAGLLQSWITYSGWHPIADQRSYPVSETQFSGKGFSWEDSQFGVWLGWRTEGEKRNSPCFGCNRFFTVICHHAHFLLHFVSLKRQILSSPSSMCVWY